MPESIVALFVLFGIIGLVSWMLAGQMDHQRIREYIERSGGQVESIQWAPFGTGWIGEKDDRIYEVVYSDSLGARWTATCKTRMLGGVYFTDQRRMG